MGWLKDKQKKWTDTDAHKFGGQFSLSRQIHAKYKKDYNRFSGKDAAKKAELEQKKTDEAIMAKTNMEKLKLKESEDEIARRRLLKTQGGNRSLLSSTLGG